MYKIVNRVIMGTNTVGYDIMQEPNGQVFFVSTEKANGIAIIGAFSNAEYNKSTDSLKGKNTDLRKLPKRQIKPDMVDMNLVQIFRGNDLKNLVTQVQDYKERFVFDRLMDFIYNEHRSKICTLYGLRRTGKTVLMIHAIRELLKTVSRDSIAFISVKETDSLYTLYNYIDMLRSQGVKYIFIDEITQLNGFVQSAAKLSDIYTRLGLKIIIAGTDSYAIKLSSMTTLYDRVVLINTTYISYKEYATLGCGNDIIEYIRSGGVFDTDAFYNVENAKKYVSTAISDNIVNSLVRANDYKHYAHLMELIDRGLLKKAIEQAIYRTNEELTLKIITDDYKNMDIGSGKNLVQSDIKDINNLDISDLEERVRYSLSIVNKFDTPGIEEYLEELKLFLENVHVLRKYTKFIGGRSKKAVLFVQPGLRYNQVLELLRAIHQSNLKLSNNDKKLLMQKILQDVEGQILEHEVLQAFLEKYNSKILKDRYENVLPKFYVTQITYMSKEIDVAIIDGNNTILYEVKRSKKVVPSQYRWLVDKEFNKYIEENWDCKIKSRVVLYLGEDTDVNTDNGKVAYRNISNFLLNMK